MDRCIAEVVLGSLCQNLSDEYTGEIISTHSSFWSSFAVRYDGSCFVTIIDVLILVQIYSIGVLEQRCDQMWDGLVIRKAYAERPWILLSNGVLSRWTNSSALRLRTLRTGAILVVSVFALLMCRHVWLESGVSTFCNWWDLENEELR